YGPHLPDDAPEDGKERGIAAFVLCASLIRQYEFAQNVWVNDKNFHELGNERDPIIGNQDGTLEYKIPKRPIRKKITGLPAFTTVRRVAWPGFERPEYEAAQFLQGIAGTLELFHRSTLDFQKLAQEATDHPVAVFQRIDQAGFKLPIDERILTDCDTLLVFGLD